MEVTVVGDVVVSGFPRKTPSEDSSPGGAAFDLLHGNSLTIGNLEAPLTDGVEQAHKLVTMRTPPSGAQELADFGFDAVSLATNHALDYGNEGMRDTVRALDQSGVAHAGFGENLAEANRPKTLNVANESVAFFSFCAALPLGFNATERSAGIASIRIRQHFEYDSGFLDETPGTPPYVHSVAHEPDVQTAERLIAEAKESHDRVIVAMHWGVPFCYLPEAQGPLAEYQRPLAHRMVDAGADLIIGHHPHCLHPAEFYGSGLVLYSTGNFVFDWCDGWRPDSMVPKEDAHLAAPYKAVLMSGPWYESAVFRVEFDASGGPRLRLVPIELDSDSQPVHPHPNAAERIITNFVENSRKLVPSISIDSDGWIHADAQSTPQSRGR